MDFLFAVFSDDSIMWTLYCHHENAILLTKVNKGRTMNLRQTAELANKICDIQWVKWVYPKTPPASTSAEKTKNVVASAILPLHCAKCLNMNGCCFAEDKCPEVPLHENCHCKTERIGGITVTAECPIEKFTGYIFNKFYNDGKEQIYKDLGFTISDSVALKAEIEKQAYNAYLSGKYKLNKLNSYGQRIDITVKLSGKTKKSYLLKPDGWSIPTEE